MKRTNTDSEHLATQERFTALVEPVHGRLLKFARAMTRDRESARDLASEAILIAWRSFDEIRDEKAMLSYLFTTATRLAIKERERGKRHTTIDGSGAEEHHGGVAPDVAAEVALLQQALAKLPEAMRECVMLFEVAGFSIEEIATMHRVSVSAVKMRLVRGRARLKDLLGLTDEEPMLAEKEKGAV